MSFLSLFPTGEQGLFILEERRKNLCSSWTDDGDPKPIPTVIST